MRKLFKFSLHKRNENLNSFLTSWIQKRIVAAATIWGNTVFKKKINDFFSLFRAIAASAPVSQFDAPCDAFGRIVTSDYTAQGKFCSDTIRLSWAAIDNVTAGLTGNLFSNFECG